MFKLIYGSLLLLLSSAAFLFSKKKEEVACKQSMVGIVKELKDNSGFYLYIETADNKVYFPYIEREDVVLSSGSKVRVCYEAAGEFHGSPLIRINHVSYLP